MELKFIYLLTGLEFLYENPPNWDLKNKPQPFEDMGQHPRFGQ